MCIRGGSNLFRWVVAHIAGEEVYGLRLDEDGCRVTRSARYFRSRWQGM
jgi:hypothetical protein